MRLPVLLAVALTLSTAHADPETSRRLDREAQALAGKGDFVGAAGKFREAFAADPRPELLCNVGVAYWKANDWPRAHRYLNQCLGLGAALDATFVVNARKVLDSIVKKLDGASFTPIDLAVSPPTASIAIEGSPFDEPIVGSRRVYVPFGTYRVVIHAEGHVDHVVELVANKRDAVSISVALKAMPRVEPSPAPPAPPAPLPPRPREPEVVHAEPSKLPAITATAVSGALVIAGVIVYLRARSEVDAAERSLEMPEFSEHRDRAKRFQKVSWVLGGLGGAGAIVSGFLWYRATRSTSTTVTVGATEHAAAISIGARF